MLSGLVPNLQCYTFCKYKKSTVTPRGSQCKKGLVSLTPLKIFLKGFYIGKNLRRNSTYASYKRTGFKVISQTQPLPHISLGLIISLSLGTWTYHFSVITGFPVRRHLGRVADGLRLEGASGDDVVQPPSSAGLVSYILDSAPWDFYFHDCFFFCIWGKQNKL